MLYTTFISLSFSRIEVSLVLPLEVLSIPLCLSQVDGYEK